MNKNIKTILYWCPTILILSLIFYFSSRTGSQSNAQSDPIAERIAIIFNISPNFSHLLVVLVRKSAHVFIYLLLSVATTFAMINTLNSKWIYLKSFILTYLFAVFDEIHQYFVPGRSGMVLDTFVDSIGIVIGIVFFYFIRKRNKQKTV